MKIKSIRYYYFTSIATVLVISTLVMGLLQTFMSISYFRNDKMRLLDDVVFATQQGARSDSFAVNPDSVRAVEYMARISGLTIYLCDQNGLIQHSTGEEMLPTGHPLPEGVTKAISENGLYQDMGTLDGLFDANHYASAGMLQSSTGEMLGYVIAVSNTKGMEVYIIDTASTYILSALLVLLVASILALFLANRTVIPVRRLSEAARRFGEGDYSARVPVEGDDELAQLALTFNEMANSFESTDASRRSFMGNIAHELRTPMTTIKGFIDGMLDGTIPVESRDKYLAVVSDEVGRLARLTRNMLDISRLEAGEYTPSNKVFNIREPLTSVFISAEQRLNDKKVYVSGLDETEPVMVLADEDFVHQILFNLVDNAIKFVDEGGTISARVQPGRGSVTVSVRNTGDGIAPEALSHIFDRFYKADQSRGMNARGAGLGLNISKVLLGLMGGRIWVTSQEGEWTEFHFTLPPAPKKWA